MIALSRAALSGMDEQSHLRPSPVPGILEHYTKANEHTRLAIGEGRLELARTREILVRHLPPPPATVLDVGGGPGVYACWLAREGYTVHLVDIVPRHIDEAKQAAAAQPEHALASMAVGDARRLEAADDSVDVVLLLGPLYHLVERADRLRALAEARRVLKTNGLLAAAAISRFASLLDGLRRDLLGLLAFADIVDRDLQDGRHVNPTEELAYFTTAYFHRPEELEVELHAAGFAHESTLAVEGPAWLLADFDARWADERRRAEMIEAVGRIEREPSMLGVSAHMLAIGRKT